MVAVAAADTTCERAPFSEWSDAHEQPCTDVISVHDHDEEGCHRHGGRWGSCPADPSASGEWRSECVRDRGHGRECCHLVRPGDARRVGCREAATETGSNRLLRTDNRSICLGARQRIGRREYSGSSSTGGSRWMASRSVRKIRISVLGRTLDFTRLIERPHLSGRARMSGPSSPISTQTPRLRSQPPRRRPAR